MSIIRYDLEFKVNDIVVSIPNGIGKIIKICTGDKIINDSKFKNIKVIEVKFKNGWKEMYFEDGFSFSSFFRELYILKKRYIDDDELEEIIRELRR
ncbi:MAG: hypothetical protein ACRC7W_01135 [Fusobacteriaceae bacterium]